MPPIPTTTADLIKDLKEQTFALEEQINNLYEKKFELDKKIKKLNLDLLKENKLFSKIPFSVNVIDNSIFLGAIEDSGCDNELTEICQLLDVGYHGEAEIKDNIYFRRSDWQYHLVIRDISLFKDFITEFDINIQENNLKKNVQEWQDHINKVTNILNLLK